MQGYAGFQKKKNKLGSTLIIVGLVHIVGAGGLYWLSQTKFGQEFLKVYKVNIFKAQEKPPEPPPLEPEPPKLEPEPPPKAPEPKPVETPPPPPPSQVARADPGPASPASDNPFAIGKSRGRFAGYADLLTGAIQQRYRQPAELPDDLEYAVLCKLNVDENGKVLAYELVGSSGNPVFDQSALEALAKLDQVRPPPPGMSREIVVKFYPPT
jgi:protein TonB